MTTKDGEFALSKRMIEKHVALWPRVAPFTGLLLVFESMFGPQHILATVTGMQALCGVTSFEDPITSNTLAGWCVELSLVWCLRGVGDISVPKASTNTCKRTWYEQMLIRRVFAFFKAKAAKMSREHAAAFDALFGSASHYHAAFPAGRAYEDAAHVSTVSIDWISSAPAPLQDSVACMQALYNGRPDVANAVSSLEQPGTLSADTFLAGLDKDIFDFTQYLADVECVLTPAPTPAPLRAPQAVSVEGNATTTGQDDTMAPAPTPGIGQHPAATVSNCARFSHSWCSGPRSPSRSTGCQSRTS